jgi:hypothetical protein
MAGEAHEVSISIVITDLVTGAVETVAIPRARKPLLDEVPEEPTRIGHASLAPTRPQPPQIRFTACPISDPATGIAWTVTRKEA